MGREEEGPLRDPGSELLLGGSARVRIINGMMKKNVANLWRVITTRKKYVLFSRRYAHGTVRSRHGRDTADITC